MWWERCPAMPNRRSRPCPKYLPAGAEPNSERYITGPDSLARFAPVDPAQHRGVPLQRRRRAGEIRTTGKETTLIVFSYPTMEMARDRIAHFQQVPGAMVKRTGPLVAVALNRGESGRGRKAAVPDQISGGSHSSGTCSDAEGQSGQPVSEHFHPVPGAGRILRRFGSGGGRSADSVPPRRRFRRGRQHDFAASFGASVKAFYRCNCIESFRLRAFEASAG